MQLTSDEPMQDPDISWLEFSFIAPSSANGAMLEICTQYEPVAGKWQPRAGAPEPS